MHRLKNKVIALFLFLVVAAVVASTYFNTRTFIVDRHNYVMELNSIAAPNIAFAIEKYLDYLEDSFGLIDEILKSAPQAAQSNFALNRIATKLKGVRQLNIYKKQELLWGLNFTKKNSAEKPISLEEVSALWTQNSKINERFLLEFHSELLFSVVIRERLYLAWVLPESLSEYFTMSGALKVNLVSQEGVVLLSNFDHHITSLPVELQQAVHQAFQKREQQSLMTRELQLSTGEKRLAALATLPRTRGALVLVEAPASELSKMIREILKSSLPWVAIILVLAAILGVLFSGQLTKPLEELTRATSKIATGNWTVDLKSKSKDEIGMLVGAFSKMGSELAAREKSLKEANEQLVRSERLAVLGKFSAGIAHEIKNPLSSILGYSQIIQKKLPASTDETITKFIGFIMDETRRASKIISDLLIFARQKSPTLHPSAVALVIKKAHEMLSPQVASAQAELLVQIEAPHVTAKLDPDQIFQVLLNLISNALAALDGKQGGASKKITLKLEQMDSHAVIRVSDNGCGISEENLSKLFEPFFSTKAVGKGSGLGLSLCHGIVNQHGGRIEVKSKLSEGTTFSIYLPAV